MRAENTFLRDITILYASRSSYIYFFCGGLPDFKFIASVPCVRFLIIQECQLSLNFDKSVYPFSFFSTTTGLIYSTEVAIEDVILFDICEKWKSINPFPASESMIVHKRQKTF